MRRAVEILRQELTAQPKRTFKKNPSQSWRSANGAAIIQPRAQRSAALGKGAEISKALKGRNRTSIIFDHHYTLLITYAAFGNTTLIQDLKSAASSRISASTSLLSRTVLAISALSRAR